MLLNFTPSERVEYVGPADPEVLRQREISNGSLGRSWLMTSDDTFSRADRIEEDWFESPMYFGIPRRVRTGDRIGYWCAYCRDGDFLWASNRTLLDGGSNFTTPTGCRPRCGSPAPASA